MGSLDSRCLYGNNQTRALEYARRFKTSIICRHDRRPRLKVPVPRIKTWLQEDRQKVHRLYKLWIPTGRKVMMTKKRLPAQKSQSDALPRPINVTPMLMTATRPICHRSQRNPPTSLLIVAMKAMEIMTLTAPSRQLQRAENMLSAWERCPIQLRNWFSTCRSFSPKISTSRGERLPFQKLLWTKPRSAFCVSTNFRLYASAHSR